MEFEEDIIVTPPEPKGEPGPAGLKYLKKHCNKDRAFQDYRVGKDRYIAGFNFHSTEIFTSLWALDLLGHLLDDETKNTISKLTTPRKDTLKKRERKIISNWVIIGPKNIYFDPAQKDDEKFPDEVDITAVYMSIYLKLGLIQKNDGKLRALAREIIGNTTTTGVIQMYFPPREIGKRNFEGHLDAAVCCNVMRLLYTLGLGDEAKATEDYIWECLDKDLYLKMGKKAETQYASPDIFLFCLARAIICNEKAKERFSERLVKAITSRLTKNKWTIDMAARLLALDALGMLYEKEFQEKVREERETLLSLQEDSGFFRGDCLFNKDCNPKTSFGGENVATILATAAIHCFIEKE